MPEHVDIGLGEMHRPHNWEYANAAARAAATGFAAGDVKKVALQLDDYSYWVLVDDSPVTWVYLAGGSGHITSAQLANMAQATVKGRESGAGTGAPSDLTAEQLATIIDAVAHVFAENASFDKAKRIKVVTLTDAATVAVNASAGDAFYLSTANSRAFGIPTNAPASGYSQVITVTIKNTSGGSVTPTLTTSGAGCWRYGTSVTALPAIAAGKSMAFTARWHQADSVWDVLGAAQDF